MTRCLYTQRLALAVAGSLALGCGDDVTGHASDAGGSSSDASASAGTTATTPSSGTSSAATDATTTGGEGGSSSADASSGGPGGTTIVYDVGHDDADAGATTGAGDSCKVEGEMDGAPPCTTRAPPESFEPDVQWSWSGEGIYDQVMATPLVINLTDDNDDGEIDLCDTPDIVVAVYDEMSSLEARLHVLDGATGALHFVIDQPVSARAYPAAGDIDGDGLPELVATYAGQGLGRLVAFEHDGTLKWTGDTEFLTVSTATALADLDNDGDVEILHGGHVADHEGHGLWSIAEFGLYFTTTAADLDGDDDLEVIVGARAYHHDGALYYDTLGAPGLPHVADIDDDGLPEVVVVTETGLSVVEHDGVESVSLAQPDLANMRPAAVHDMDGDGAPEIVVGAANTYSMLEADMSVVWTADVLDGSGFAAGTAFDFLGDGTAEAMYADETTLFVFGEGGLPLLTTPRSSWTQFEYPVVADVDNDGSAEIVVVSNEGYNMGTTPAVQVIRDVEDRWVPARRIWNQHTYHVSNVREDGTIPAFEPKHWQGLNTFRTQAQVGSGGICKPEPPE